MQTIFEVTDDDGSVSYLHIGDAASGDDTNATYRSQFGYANETFGQSGLRRNKAVMWSQSELHPAHLFPQFNLPN